MGTIKYSGPVASFHCPTNAEIRSLKVHFSPKQEGSGDPSPENVRPIVGWDGVEVYRNDSTINYEFGVLGKNKFNWNVPVSESSPVGSAAATAREFTLDTYVIGMSVNNYYRQNYANWVLNPSVENGVISFSSGSASGYGIAFPLKLAAGQTYFLSGTGDGAVGATYYNEDGELISYQNGRLNKTITVPENTAITLIGFYANTSNTEFTFSDIQLELGSTATAYEPYDPNKTVYGGWVDLISGEVQQEWGLRILNGSEVWSTQNPHANYNRIFLTSFASDGIQSLNILVNWIRPISTGNDPGMYIDGNLCCRLGWADKQFYILNAVEYLDEVVDIASFKEYLSNHNLQVVYPLAAPITYQLAPTSMQTFLSANNVWTNADYVEVEYDLHETQTLLQRKAFIMANQPHIESASGAIASFKTDLRAPLRECKAYFSPVQDLHGYSNPWPAGGGKNIAKPYDNSYVSSTYISFDYSAANGTFRCYGTASASSTHSSPSATNAINNGATFTLPAGTYTISIIDGDGANIYAQCVSSTETVLAETTSYTTFTTNESLTVFVRLKVAAAATVDKTVKIQLEKGSSATSYVPYENVCDISGWTELDTFKSGKNMAHVYGYSASTISSPTSTRYTTNSYGTTLSTTSPEASVTITQSQWPESTKASYKNGYIAIGVDNMIFGAYYDVSFKVSNITNNPLNASLSNLRLTNPNGSSYMPDTIENDLIIFKNRCFAQRTTSNLQEKDWQIRICGMSFTLSEFMVTPANTSDGVYEAYNGTTIPVSFPATKNLFDEQYENISINLTYKSLYVGNNSVTASSDIPLTTNNYSNLFILPGQVSSGASTGTNNFNLGQTRTVTPIDGYVTIGYRNNYDIDPRNYHVQIESGSTATAYEPYGNVYSGYVDLIKGELVETWGYKILNGSESWITYTNSSEGTSFYVRIGEKQVGFYTSICDAFKNVYQAWNSANKNNTGIYSDHNNSNYVYFRAPNSEISTVNEFTAWLDNNPIQVVYQLETPITYQLTPQQLKSLRGVNNIWANNANGNIETKYWTH